MRKRRPGRPKGSKNATDVVVVERSHCPKCGSGRRSEYWGKVVNRCAGLRADGTPYTAISPARPCVWRAPPVRFDRLTALSLPKGRCLDCGQVRIDKEYL